ncbi:MAG: L-histidine N(alpha)-methyltransferase [Alphaproteobacteria bacterium]|nr:L-histidine N(alpha)-methyltransferase [Alphaproteobacteria bacterium]
MHEQDRAASPAALSSPYGDLAFLLDLDPPASDFRHDVHEGLAATPKRLSPMYLYDERGSLFFQKITTLETYYPTRTERSLFEDNARAIGEAIGPGRAVFEYGAGSPEKIELLLSLMQDPRGYVGMDISREFLIEGMQAFAARTGLPVGAVCADFNDIATLPKDLIDPEAAWLGFFPGSTIGNISTDAAGALLRNAAATLGRGAAFLLGVDLEKDPDVLRLAYDEPAGVTAEFILNILPRIRDELGASLDIGAFKYEIDIRDNPQRIEMYVTAVDATEIRLDGRAYGFDAGERMQISRSQKYSLEGLDSLLDSTPWRRERTWIDEACPYALCLLGNG